MSGRGCGSGDGGATAPRRKPRVARRALCKCKERRAVIHVRAVAYCRECFCKLLDSKARGPLRRAAPRARGHQVVLAYNGDAGSTTLLDVLHSALGGGEARKGSRMFFQFKVVVVDTSSLVTQYRKHDTTAEYRAKMDGVLAWATNFGYAVHVARLEDLFAPGELRSAVVPTGLAEGIVDAVLPVQPANVEALTALFGRAKTVDAKTDLLRALTGQALLQLAQLAFPADPVYLVRGNTNSCIAVRVIEGVSKGLGYSLPVLVQEVHRTHARVVQVFGLQEVEVKEAVMFCRLRGLPTTFFPTFGTKAPPRTSVRQVTQGLVAELQAGFPATVYNIVKTVRKLTLPPDYPPTTGKPLSTSFACPICSTLVAVPPEAPSSSPASLHNLVCRACSRMLEEMGMGAGMDEAVAAAKRDLVGTGGGAPAAVAAPPASTSLAPPASLAAHVPLREELGVLPEFVTEGVKRLATRSEMRALIGDAVLEWDPDDDDVAC